MYWTETAALEERMTGVSIEKQDAIPFTVVGKDGNVYQVSAAIINCLRQEQINQGY
jgi:hypothetical protein